jgi:hypothetical protein
MSTIQIQKKKTLADISPLWAHIIKNGVANQTAYRSNDTKRCVVGEAYGFSNSYAEYHNEKYCDTCNRIGWRFWSCEAAERTDSFNAFGYTMQQVSDMFVEHWNEVHA